MEPHASRETLVCRAQGGDRDAFEELFATYRERLAAVVRCRLGAGLRGRVEVEDVLQETFVRAFPAVARFEERHADSFFLWLSGIAVNVVSDGRPRGAAQLHERAGRWQPAHLGSGRQCAGELRRAGRPAIRSARSEAVFYRARRHAAFSNATAKE
jgi:DNA-directed RNA polymerase specialized sigma24 family protein